MSASDPKIVLLAVLVLALWIVYFAVCGAPLGAEFIYADF